jgi:uncharacterized protein YcaQ
MTIARLRRTARLATLFPPVTLGAAVARLGFVQADPIRSPARAQDLILRHRVSGYRAGDLERRFARLGIEEDYLYAYGFMPGETWQLVHPRLDPHGEKHVPSGLAAEVLAFVRAHGQTHPSELEAQFGRELAVNNWGGMSKATTRALDSLQRWGLLRVAQRRNGIRVYAAAPEHEAALAPGERARRLVILVARILAPAPMASLRRALALTAWRNTGLGRIAPVLAAALEDGLLEREEVEGETYVWPADLVAEREVKRDVRLLAPFDPLVWDRRRFAHLWGWEYRFEAYTPAPRRQYGYYAMPLLWGDNVIGWANLSVKAGKLDAAMGYVGKAPASQAFRRALDAELGRMERFLGL